MSSNDVAADRQDRHATLRVKAVTEGDQWLLVMNEKPTHQQYKKAPRLTGPSTSSCGAVAI